jgi:hypothetical protein
VARWLGIALLIGLFGFSPAALATNLSSCGGSSTIQHLSSEKAYAVTVNQLKVSRTAEEYISLDDHETILYADLSVEALKDGISVNPFYASLRDPNGFTYEPMLFSSAVQSLGSEDDLLKGEVVRGWVAFKVPRQISDQGALLLQWKPFSGGRVKLNLRQEFCN